MIALQGDFSLNFLRGVLATVNPCGFALLPTYLMFFLGIEGARPGTQRASIRRALVVGATVSAGFLAVFTVIGTIYRAGFTWFSEQAGWLSIAVGALMIVVGIAMLFGWRPAVRLPKLNKGGTDGTLVSMFLYGVSYAIASIGCALPLFTSALVSVSSQGIASGVATVAVYGLGMGLMLTALTVSLALARTGLLDILRNGMKYLDVVAGCLLIVTGIYMILYGQYSLTLKSNRAVHGALTIQGRVENWLHGLGTGTLVAVLGGITGSALLYVMLRRERPGTSTR
jgi:cytochrome c-type biogenesis protein